jgi:PAS domain S-box-containing protein
LPYARWLAQALGLVLFHLVGMGAGREEGLWLPGLGLGIALVSWFGWWYAALLAVDLFVVRIGIYPSHPLWLVAMDSALLAAQIAGSWWCYSVAAQGTRWLDDPRSATVFLLIVPGVLNAATACFEALVWSLSGVEPNVPMWSLASALGICRALGILTLAPSLLVLVTPLLTHLGLLAVPAAERRLRRIIWTESTWGELIELAGLTLGNALLTLVLVYLRVERDIQGWTLWGISLLFVVWTSLRQGLQGGLFTATIGAVVALLTATLLGADPGQFNPMQGNLLGQTSTALLVGASASWIRASETRYRRVVGQIPVILYSVRLPRSLPIRQAGEKLPGSKLDVISGPGIIQVAELTLVSQASKKIFGLEPAALEGPFTRWLEHVHADDRELVIAAVTQLVLQKQPVTCEYRVAPTSAAGAPDANGPPRAVVWVRDTMAPHHGAENRLDGWDGVIEDITEARALSQNVRRTSGMLQALVANLPTGVFFVQGPWGQPILVNARARQLLGQREDLSAGAAHISEIYRLHRPDGTPYPAEELPIVKALRFGTTCLANDIVVHRLDGRRVPLITWAAPVDLGNLGRPEAAVWVLEDMTTLHQAELARSESEARLRATFEALGEGLLIQDRHGNILECNPAAADILGVTPKDLLGQTWLGLNHDCLQADGTPLPPDQQPDRVALTTGQAVRNFIVGMPKDGHLRWLQVNSVPLPLGTVLGGGDRGVRLVTTFADITGHRQTQEDLQKSQRLELMGRLASGTVHDFNNMLTALLGMASLARGGLTPEDPVRDDLNRIIDIGEQAANVAGQLLAFSKQRRAEARPIDINGAVVHALAILKGIIPDAIHAETQLASGELWVLADDTQLQQIVMNLCLNARDAMPTGGTLTVSTTRAVEGEQAWIRCAIQDTGCGMDSDTVAHIFEPFFTTKERGTGLGLAVVRQIIQQFDGRIEVKSEAGKGTQFEFWLREHTPPHEWSV